MKLFNTLLLSGLMLFPLNLFSQQDIGIGEWMAYIPFNQSFAVAQSDNFIYSGAERGILKVHKSDLSTEKITKINGLSDTEPREMIFESSSQTLVIIYGNGNIDMMTSQGIFNMPNILNNSTIFTSKQPNRLRLDASGKAYVAFDFGLFQLNPQSFTFGFSLRTEFEVYDFVQWNDKFYFTSANGVYMADANPNLNHADLSIWKRLSVEWPTNYISRSIAVLDNRLFCDLNGDLVEIVDNKPQLVRTAPDEYFMRGITAFDDEMAVVFQHDNTQGGFKIDLMYFLNSDGAQLAAYTNANCSVVVHDLIKDENGRIFYSNETSFKYFEEIGGGCTQIQPLGPLNTDAFEITFRGNEVINATGETGENNSPLFNLNGIYYYNDGVWNQFNHKNGFYGDSVFSYTDVDIGPNGQLAVGTYRQGLILISQDWSFAQLLNENNSCIDHQELVGIATISDVRYDRQGNLWLTNYRASEPLKMIDQEGNCYRFPKSASFGSPDVLELTIDERGYKWIGTLDEASALIVFDEGELDDPSDDRFKRVSSANSELTSNKVNDIETDLDGDIWVGTDRGAVVFECASAIFDNGCSGRRPIVEVDGVAALLLENERVRAIAVDGANRKWFGTSNGIFVQSPNGEEEVLRFDERNSPLISNLIRDISINQLTGEVFISTDKGLMSYRTDATEGGLVHLPESEVYAFPNPVRPEYDGLIAIKGLPRDARVKITDIKGQLFFETEANGGEAIWNGRDYNGNRAASGVYLVFSTSQSAFEKPDALVSKILIVN